MRMIGLVLMLLGGVLNADAGFIIEADYTDHALAPTPVTLMVFLDQGVVKIATSALTGSESALLYNRAAETVHQIDYDDRTYLEINEASMNKVQRGLQGVSDFLRDAFGYAGSAEEAREEADAPSGFQVQYTKQRKRIGALDCEQALVFQHGLKIQEVWFAPWEQAGIQKSDLMDLIKLVEFYERLWSFPGASALSQSLLHIPVDGLLQLTGYPVLIRMVRQKRPHLTIQLGAPRRVPLRASMFAVPEGLTRVWL